VASRRKKHEQDSGTPDPKAAEEAADSKEELSRQSAEESRQSAEESRQSAVGTRQDEGADADEGTPETASSEDKPRRRGSIETSTRKEPAREAPRGEDGAVEVRARARYVRSAPRKARLVMDHIKGKPVDQARAILGHAERTAAEDISKLLESAIANAENNFELDADELRVAHAYVDEGPTLRRYRPRALGRATRINKRTSHMTITLTTASEE
jgi:large subunit ribosomal protein L22